MKQKTEVLPHDAYNETLVANVHPADWVNPEPSGCYNLVVIGAGTGMATDKVGEEGFKRVAWQKFGESKLCRRGRSECERAAKRRKRRVAMGSKEWRAHPAKRSRRVRHPRWRPLVTGRQRSAGQ
jgi:hypothetical protein